MGASAIRNSGPHSSQAKLSACFSVQPAAGEATHASARRRRSSAGLSLPPAELTTPHGHPSGSQPTPGRRSRPHTSAHRRQNSTHLSAHCRRSSARLSPPQAELWVLRARRRRSFAHLSARRRRSSARRSPVSSARAAGAALRSPARHTQQTQPMPTLFHCAMGGRSLNERTRFSRVSLFWSADGK